MDLRGLFKGELYLQINCTFTRSNICPTSDLSATYTTRADLKSTTALRCERPASYSVSYAAVYSAISRDVAPLVTWAVIVSSSTHIQYRYVIRIHNTYVFMFPA